MLDQLERRAELVVEALGIVPDHRETAAPEGAVGTERSDDHVTAWSDGVPYGLDVAFAVIGIREEMEDSTVMPEVETLVRQNRSRDIDLDPGHLVGSRTQPIPRSVQGGRRDVKDRQSRVTIREKVIHEPGRTAPDVDDGAGLS